MKYVGLNDVIEAYRKSLPRDRTQFATEADFLKELGRVKEVLYYGATIKAGESMMSSRDVMSPYPIGKQRHFVSTNHDALETRVEIMLDEVIPENKVFFLGRKPYEVMYAETVSDEVTDDEAILEEDT